jgi:predicted nucleic acid-binding protein
MSPVDRALGAHSSSAAIARDVTGQCRRRGAPDAATLANRWGRLLAQAGRPLPAIDSLLAATALAHGLTLITRNLRDFQHRDLRVLDPWTA